jgi:hypothetical protein
LSKKGSVEGDFEEANRVVERIAKEELRKIKEKAGEIKKEAEKIGESVEASMKQAGASEAGKKG